MGIFLKRGSYYIDYYYQGKRIRELVGPNKTLAKDALTKRKAQIAEGKFFPERQTSSVTFEDFAQEYWELHGKFKRTKSYRLMMDKLVKHFGAKRLSSITAQDILEYRNLVKERASIPTANRHHSLIRAIFYKAMQWEKHKGDNPAAKVKLEREQGHRLRFLSREEMTALLKVCNSRIYPVVATALFTGMRKGELLNLSWENVDLKHSTIYILESKSGKPREVPIAPKLGRILLEIGPKNQGSVFNVPEITLRRYFAKALKEAGITGFRFHDLRHTFASHFIMRTNDMPALQQILGHYSPLLTQRYAHLSKGHMAANMQIFDSGMDTIWTPESKIEPGVQAPKQDFREVPEGPLRRKTLPLRPRQ